MVAPASAATGTLAYTCTVPVSGAKPFTAVADTDAPGKIAYGETVTPTATGTITFPEDVTTTLRDAVGAKKVDGKADVAATVDGVATPWTLAVPQTNVPPNGSLVLTGTGPAGTFTGTKVGTVYDIAVGNFTATINNYQANGTPTTTLPTAVVPCVLNPGQNAAVDTIKVVKDVTTTTVKAPDISKGEQARAKVKVVSDHGQTRQGQDQGQAGPQRQGHGHQAGLAAGGQAQGEVRVAHQDRELLRQGEVRRQRELQGLQQQGRVHRRLTGRPGAGLARPSVWETPPRPEFRGGVSRG